MAILKLSCEKTGAKGTIEIKNKTPTIAELYIFGDIVGTEWEKWAPEDKCPMEIVDFLKEVEDKEEIHMYINSGGGDAFAGKAMYEILMRSKARKVAHIDGMAASAATMPLFAADEIIAPAGALVMMHDPWTFAIGNSVDLRKTVETLEKLEESYAEIYRAHLKSDTEVDIRQKMHDEWWVNGAELADFFENVKTEETRVAACSSAMFVKYKNLPESALKKAKEDEQRDEKEKLLLMIDAI
ncbi:head maturation protease, ClpP-related [Anaeromassilibacillus senegalensis]|uniref:head maturation protease, ClpP-related n=1 Tax=Anaeromassilibacillus senegalensis TaxID=1673717 RepID=UPI00067FEF89|nr:head maturation protease, ClpP-related [Anaeromassilibacillus senegalensis]